MRTVQALYSEAHSVPQCRPEELTTSLVLILLLKIFCKRLSTQTDLLVAQAIPPFGKYSSALPGDVSGHWLGKSTIGRIDLDAS